MPVSYHKWRLQYTTMWLWQMLPKGTRSGTSEFYLERERNKLVNVQKILKLIRKHIEKK